MTNQSLFYYLMGLYSQAPYTYRDTINVFAETKEGKQWKEKQAKDQREVMKVLGILSYVANRGYSNGF